MIETLGSAFQALRRRPLRSGLLVLEVAVGAAALFVVAASLLGLREAVRQGEDRAGAFFTVINGQVQRDRQGRMQGMSMFDGFTQDDAEALRKSSFARGVSPLVPTGGMLEAVAGGVRYMVPGTLGVGADFASMAGIKVLEGAFYSRREEAGAGVCAISRRLARQFFGGSSALGQTILLSPGYMSFGGAPEAARPKAMPCRVVAVVEVPRDKGLVSNLPAPVRFGPADLLLPPAFLARAGRGSPGFSYLLVQAREGQGKAARKEAVQVLKERQAQKRGLDGGSDSQMVFGSFSTSIAGGGAGPGGQPRTTVDILESGDETRQMFPFLQRYLLFFAALGLIALVVAGIGIFSGSLVAALERTREAGLRRALGATRRRLLAQSLAEACWVGALGGAAGILLGAVWLRAAAADPGRGELLGLAGGWRWDAAGLAVLAAVLVSCLAAFYPAFQVSGQPPAEALREG